MEGGGLDDLERLQGAEQNIPLVSVAGRIPDFEIADARPAEPPVGDQGLDHLADADATESL